MVSENYACAYKEIIEVLKYTKREDVNKIPQCKIVLWKQNMKKDYDFKIDPNKSLEDQNLSNETKAIIANIFKKYWATDYQKERIELKEKYDREQAEKEKVKPKDDEELQRTLPYLRLQLKSLVARDLWDMSEYFQLMNAKNDIVQRALQLLN